jgi:HAD superfamily hydrolase (TIGR01509 family)
MMLKTPLQGLLFDFDGLILDTETPIFKAWEDKFEEYGKKLLLEEWAEILGKSNDELGPLEGFLNGFDEEHKRKEILAEVSKRESELVLQQKPLPGVKELIIKAKEHKLILGIVSSSDQNWVHSHLERLGLRDYFDHTSCAEEVEIAKPDPALYTLGLKKSGLDRENVLVLEDSPHGVLAAKKAGLFCIAVPNQLTSQLPFYNHGGGPDLVLSSMLEFPWNEFMRDDR